MPITVDGATLETRWWGPGPEAAPSLVLLHEGLGSVGLWRDFPDRLATITSCGVFAWSRAGYGRSDPVALPRPLSYMHDEAARLGRVLDAADIRRCILIGHSDGASIAAIYAGSSQDFRVRGLVLIAPHYFVEDVAVTAIADARDAYPVSLRERLARHHDHVDITFRGWNDAWLDPRFRAWDITDALPYIRVPVLQLQGTQDPYGTTAQTDRAEALCHCPVETALLTARHAPHLEAPDASLAAIGGFARHILKVHEGEI